jgi:hypothetical protein
MPARREPWKAFAELKSTTGSGLWFCFGSRGFPLLAFPRALEENPYYKSVVTAGGLLYDESMIGERSMKKIFVFVMLGILLLAVTGCAPG